MVPELLGELFESGGQMCVGEGGKEARGGGRDGSREGAAFGGYDGKGLAGGMKPWE